MCGAIEFSEGADSRRFRLAADPATIEIVCRDEKERKFSTLNDTSIRLRLRAIIGEYMRFSCKNQCLIDSFDSEPPKNSPHLAVEASRILAKIPDAALRALGISRGAHVTTVQDQVMVGVF